MDHDTALEWVPARRWPGGETVWVPHGSLHRMGNSGTRPGRLLLVAPNIVAAEREMGVSADVANQEFLGVHFEPDDRFKIHCAAPSHN